MSKEGWRGWVRGVVAAAAIMLAAPAGALTVTSGFTGNWFDPDEDGQGLQFEILEIQGETQVLALWFLVDANGDLLWLFGQAPVVGDTATIPMYQPEGGSFGEPTTGATLWGEITLVFNSCNSAVLEFAAESPGKAEQVGTGFKNLQRLTQIKGSDCTGGVSDDLPPRTLPQDFQVNLAPTSAAPPGANGLLTLEVRPGRMELKVKLRGLDVGQYDLTLDGSPVAAVDVQFDDSGNEGELELESPAGPGDVLLDFDPRGGTVAIEQGGTIFLSSEVPGTGSVPGSGEGNPPPFGNIEFEVQLTNTGVYPAGDGEAEFEQESDRVDFKVEIEDVPAGSYGLFVGGQQRGNIVVSNRNGGIEGEIEFRFPGEPGKALLDFDPRGQEIEVREGGTAIFTGTLLNGGGDDDSGGDSGSGGGDDSGGDDGSGGNDGELRVAIELTATAAAGGASGDAEYRRESDRTRFDVEIEDVADGGYTLEVDGVPRGTIQVVDGEGELEFRDPSEPGKELLDFDPLGKTVRVLEGGTVILQGTMPDGS